MRYGRLLILSVLASCAVGLAQAQPCPATFAGWVGIGTGSCVVPGLGTISNVRFSISGASSTQMSVYAGQAALSEGYGAPNAITLELDANNYGTGGTFGSTAGFSFACRFTPEPGVTTTGLSLLVGQGAYGSPAGPTSVAESVSVCLNGTFTGFPPTACSGTTQNIDVPAFDPWNSFPNPAALTFSATSMDVYVSATGSGETSAVYPAVRFTFSGQPSQALPTITSVVNAASWIPPALPNGGIAQGGIFVVSGSNLGPAAISVASPPFQSTSLAGTSVYVTVGDTMVEAPMYYSLAGYVAALLPSNTPVGQGAVVVTYNGLTSSNAYPISVVESNLGIFTVTSNGEGSGIVTYPDYSLTSPAKAANCGGPYTTCGAANPGDILILWGTGLGPVNGSDTAGAGLGVNMTSVPLTLWLGGVQISASYQGRSGCCIGEDQIVFKIPQNAPTGCAVPLAVQIGNETSNSTVIAVANGSRTCTPANPAITPSIMQALGGSAPLTIGRIAIERKADSTSNTGYVDNGKAQFEKVTVPTALEPFTVSYVDSEPVGTCVIYNSLSTSISPPFASTVGSDAGPNLTVNGPNGTESLTVTQGLVPTEYDGVLNSVGKYLIPGAYTVAGTGGANVGSFSALFNIPTPPNWTNQTSLSTVTRTNGLTVNWGGVLGNNSILIEGVSATDATLTKGAAFSCIAPASAGTFTVPPEVLQTLPAGNYGTLYFKPAVDPIGFAASGLNLGYVTSNLLTAIPTVFK